MARCENMVVQMVPRGYGYREVSLRCGSTSIHGGTLQCEHCEKSDNRRYPQGWRYSPGDTCKHGTYMGSHEDNDEVLCGACEFE